MSVAKDDVIFPQEDLCSDEPPLETSLHLQQMLLLIKCFILAVSHHYNIRFNHLLQSKIPMYLIKI